MNKNLNTTTVDATHRIGCVGKPFADGGLLVMENLQEEIWKDVVGYEGLYRVSNFGRILCREKSVYCGHKNLQIRVFGERNKSIVDRKGYNSVSLSKNGEVKRFFIHRLVAIAFIPNPLNLPQVHHIDEDKRNNTLPNLMWTNNSGNQKESYNSKSRKNRLSYFVKVYCYSESYTETIFKSTSDASRFFCVDRNIIIRAAKDKKIYKGFLISFTPISSNEYFGITDKDLFKIETKDIVAIQL